MSVQPQRKTGGRVSNKISRYIPVTNQIHFTYQIATNKACYCAVFCHLKKKKEEKKKKKKKKKEKKKKKKKMMMRLIILNKMSHEK